VAHASPLRRDDYVLVSFVGRHEHANDIHRIAAEIIPELAETGRNAKDKPACCDDLGEPPVAPDLVELVARLV